MLTFHGSRSEFVSSDLAASSTSDEDLKRTGGCFITTRKAVVLGAGILLVMFMVIAVIYVSLGLGLPCKGGSMEDDEQDEDDSALQKNDNENILQSTDYRLPRTLQPTYYRLFIEPDIRKSFFKGHVIIIMRCVEKTDSIIVHLKDLLVDGKKVTVSEVKVSQPDIATVTTMTDAEITTIKTPSNRSENLDALNMEVSKVNKSQVIRAPRLSSSLVDGERKKRSIIRQVARTKSSDYRYKKQITVLYDDADNVRETYTVTIDPPLQPGRNYSLEMVYTGFISNKLEGLFKSTHVNITSGFKREILVTQFEPTHARSVFPCFDEPNYKAVFEISIARPENMTVLSNMPLRKTEAFLNNKTTDSVGWVWDHFTPTPPMSTYLVAFVVADPGYGLISKKLMAPETSGRNLSSLADSSFQVLVASSEAKKAENILSAAPKILTFFSEYFQIPYTLPKLDIVTVPDLGPVAMENWGLITFRESNFLHSLNSTTAYMEEKSLKTLAHELAQQWFGNLVTMSWWSGIWLNEGFAEYFMYLGINNVLSTYDILNKFVIDTFQRGLFADGLQSTQPITLPTNNSAQVSQVFNPISYEKGACLLRMLNNSLTEEVFKSGIITYLKTWQMKNTNEDDVWDVLTVGAKSAGVIPENLNVKQIMKSWTKQKGYPVLTVSRDYDKRSAKITQNRFTLKSNSSENNPLWTIPITYASQGEDFPGTKPKMWLEKKMSVIDNITLPATDKWVLFNLKQTGFYRVNYDLKNWELFITHLKTSPNFDKLLDPATRSQLIDDSFNLARAGYVSYVLALNLSLYLDRERNYIPWASALDNFHFLNNVLQYTEAYGDFQNFLIKLMLPVFKILGFDKAPKENQPQTLFRQYIVSMMAILDYSNVTNWSLNIFQNLMDSKNSNKISVPVDLKTVIYCTAIRKGGVKEWSFLYDKFIKSFNDEAEKKHLIYGLTCTRDIWLLVKILQKSFKENDCIRIQDAFQIWNGVSQNPLGSRLVFDYIRDNWDFIYIRFGRSGIVFKKLIQSAIKGLRTQSDLLAVLEFKKMYKDKLTYVDQVLDQQIEKLELKIEWMKKYYSTVKKCLEIFK